MTTVRIETRLALQTKKRPRIHHCERLQSPWTAKSTVLDAIHSVGSGRETDRSWTFDSYGGFAHGDVKVPKRLVCSETGKTPRKITTA